MVPLAEQPLAQVLEEVAAATPAPGGGSSAACTCALAAALVEMAARLGLARGAGPPPGASERARVLRERALRLAERELSAYLPVLEASRLTADHPDRRHRLRVALSEAATTPLAIAEAAAAAAAALVEINLEGLGEEDRLAGAHEARRRAADARARALAI